MLSFYYVIIMSFFIMYDIQIFIVFIFPVFNVTHICCYLFQPEPPAVNRDTRRLPPTPLDTYPHTGTASGPTHPILNHNVAQNKSNISHENSVDNGQY